MRQYLHITRFYSNNKIYKFCILSFFTLFLSIIYGQNKNTSIFIGTELREMAGVPLHQVGSQNYALMGGVSFKISEKFNWGFRGISIKKQINDNQSVTGNTPNGIKGYDGINASKKIERVYLDGHYTIRYNKVKIEPGLSLGIGHNHWEFVNEEIFERYLLQTNVLSLGGRVRITAFEYPFIELGAVDAFAYTWKSNDTSYQMGESQITLNQRAGIFNWIFVGVNIPLK